MASISPSHLPCISRFAGHAEEMVVAGEINPIALPLVPFAIIDDTIGIRIARGDTGSIHSVKGAVPQRVYKIISYQDFINGDEIRISQIAGEIGVAPAFHGACLYQKNTKLYVVIEMDYAGKSFTRWQKDFANEFYCEDERVEACVSPSLIAQEQAKKVPKENEISKLGVALSPQIPQLPAEETLDALYENPEAFYFELFSKIRMLVDLNIAYIDTHFGNIMPKSALENRLQLIDFESAEIKPNATEAAIAAANSKCNSDHLQKFSRLPNLSAESRALIAWFRSYQRNEKLAPRFSRGV